MSVILKVNNVDISDQVVASSLRLEQNITSKVDVLTFDYRKHTDRTFVPVTGDDVTITHDGTKIFGGTIVEHRQFLEGADILLYRITVKDYTHLLDRKLVANVYDTASQTVTDIVEDIVDTYCADITHVNVDTIDVEISEIAFDYVRPSDAIRDLAGMVGADWWVDEDKDLHFTMRGDDHAPFDLDDGNQSHVNTSLELRKSDKQLKNIIYVIGGEYDGVSTKDKIADGDGTQKRFRVPYKYKSVPTVWVNGSTVTVGIEFIDTTGFTCYWNQNEKTITFTTAPTSGHAIESEGIPRIPLLVKMKSPDTSKGEYEYKIEDKTLTSMDAVRKRAKAELDAYANSIEEGSFLTYRDGLKVGQKIYVNSTTRGITAEKYVIQQVLMTMHGKADLKYHVKLANVKAYEIIEFMRDLLRAGERGTPTISNPAVSLNTIVAFAEQVGVRENYSVNTYRKTLAERCGVSETILLRKDFAHTWVWGEYTPTGISDVKRVPLWDRGALWG